MIVATLLLLLAITPCTPDSGDAPSFPGYVVEDHGEWRWASRDGKSPPGDKLARVIDRSLTSLRAKLATREPHGVLIVYTADTKEFRRAVVRMGAKAPPSQTLAVAFPDRGVMILDGRKLRSQPSASTTETIAHELAHLLLSASPQDGIGQYIVDFTGPGSSHPKIVSTR